MDQSELEVHEAHKAPVDYLEQDIGKEASTTTRPAEYSGHGGSGHPISRPRDAKNTYEVYGGAYII